MTQPSIRAIFGHIFGGEPDPFLPRDRHVGLELVAIETCGGCKGSRFQSMDAVCTRCDGAGKVRIYTQQDTLELPLEEYTHA